MRSEFHMWLKLGNYLRPYAIHEILLLLLLLLGNAATLASPYFLKIIVDEVFPDKDYALLTKIIVILFFVYLLRVTLKFLSDYLCTWISNQIMTDLSTNVYRHVIQLPLSFFKERNVGDIVHRMNNDVNQIRHALTGSIIIFLNNSFTICGLITVMCLLSWKLFSIVMAVYPLIFFSLRFFQPKIKESVEKIKKIEADVLSYFTERITNIKTIKSFHSYDHEYSSFNRKMESLGKQNLKTEICSSGSQNTSTLILSLIPLVVLGYGGYQVLNDGITIGVLIAFLQYANKLYDPFQSTVKLYAGLVSTSVSVRRVFELFEHPVQFQEQKEFQPLRYDLSRIVFNNVSFSHKNKEVLKDINLEFEIGKHYGIVGASGCGKTTLLDLLCKFEQPDKGTITIDNINLQHIHHGDWMTRVGVNNQGGLLFNDSVYNNIRYGNFDAENNSLISATNSVLLFDEANHAPEQIYQPIGNAGCKLSGGQRQKVLLARVILRKPEIMIIDESTSEIDSLSEETIYNTLFGGDLCKTVIVISHRLSSLRKVDEIIFLGDGKVIERGSFEQLIRNRKHFYHLFEEQLHIVPA